MPRTFTHCRFLPPLLLAAGLFVAGPGSANEIQKTPPAPTPPAGSTTALPLPASAPVCGRMDDYFAEQVWTKVAARSCLKCHKDGGDAEDSKLVLQDPTRAPDPAAALRHNREAFARMATLLEKGEKNEARLLVKVRGGLDHGGDDVLAEGSTGYRILAEFSRRERGEPAGKIALPKIDAQARPFFEGVTMVDDRKLLRRVTLSLAGRLPSESELAAVEKGGLPALAPILDAVMKEEAFYDRLAEAFNDIFLTRGFDDNAETVLSYEHFPTRLWTQKHDLTSAGDAAAQQKARYKLTDDYREAMLREPMELIKYIVRNERPFNEIVTADYILVSPYTARGYGVFEEMRGQFKNPEDPFEYLPVRIKALKNRGGKVQESTTGFYPHAGLLTTFHYLRRYPTTETNRNRLRSRMYYQQFLGIDVLELAPRVTDAAAVTAKFEVPTMQASECVVCHTTLDPVAGLFQDYYSLPEGLFQPRKAGWFQDMFGPGLEGEDLPKEQRWRALQWLGERTAKDPRFATTMVEHVHYVLTGRKTLLPPTSLDDPLYDAKARAYQAQRQEVEAIAGKFKQGGFNLKLVFQAWVASPFYRADHLTTPAADPQRQAELADVGIARMLAPEQIERKVAAIFGEKWGRLSEKQVALLYGGIDSKEVTERATDPSGAMGAIQRIMANDVACKNVASDFTLPAAQRRLFPGIEPDVLPGVSPEDDHRLRAAIVHLHRLVLGRYEATETDLEVERTFRLLTGILEDFRERKGVEPLENYSCRASGEKRMADPQYTVRAWRAVLTYLLRQQAFLYE